MVRHILLDTSPIVAHMRGRINIVDLTPPDSLLFLSLFTLGELEKGYHRAVNSSRERSRIDALLDLAALIMPDFATAEIYGRVSADLENRGQRIPENDMWIAAVALEGDMKLATGDAHFDRVEGLDVLRWSW